MYKERYESILKGKDGKTIKIKISKDAHLHIRMKT